MERKLLQSCYRGPGVVRLDAASIPLARPIDVLPPHRMTKSTLRQPEDTPKKLLRVVPFSANRQQSDPAFDFTDVQRMLHGMKSSQTIRLLSGRISELVWTWLPRKAITHLSRFREVFDRQSTSARSGYQGFFHFG
jgi:hypothetical protein